MHVQKRKGALHEPQSAAGILPADGAVPIRHRDSSLKAARVGHVLSGSGLFVCCGWVFDHGRAPDRQ